ncbi:glycosyl transferase family 2 [Methanothermus fervidus DSM 2088]|uniref:Glycosyl transferase family 2 n=1 Tax=Methanothermus fervidus (strain ATCC 43054 / DSM 2088 / JCM 10308 / V24 S) TaxID=523846 RepID=E3GW99_METFV|nr:glycosyltransferase family 2 protein [Methanothermus fervidus]ADP77864.1 glycosyl transferase family 2 [Methanothermus fervidus DSM 2088]
MKKNIIIIPAYNEEKSIGKIVKECLKYGEVLVVDDGSTDNTSKIAKKYGAKVIKHEKNKGKGAALKTGIKAALKEKYDTLIFLDADGQHDPKFIPYFLDKKADMVIGSRFLHGIEEMPLQRRLSNMITTKIINLITKYNLTDSQCGFRAIKAKNAEIFLSIPYNDYIFESAAIIKAAEHGLKVEEVPITCKYQGRKSYIKLRDIVKFIIFLIKTLGGKLCQKKAL